MNREFNPNMPEIRTGGESEMLTAKDLEMLLKIDVKTYLLICPARTNTLCAHPVERPVREARHLSLDRRAQLPSTAGERASLRRATRTTSKLADNLRSDKELACGSRLLFCFAPVLHS